jgi:two-component system response regulator ResD
MLSAPRVLVIEDDDAIRTLLVTALGRESLEVDEADDGDQALRLTAERDYTIIVLDLMMPRVDGLAFLAEFSKMPRAFRPIVIVVTAFDDLVVERIPADRVHAIIRKPFDVLRLVTIIREVALAAHVALEPAAKPAPVAEPEAVVLPAVMPLPAC